MLRLLARRGSCCLRQFQETCGRRSMAMMNDMESDQPARFEKCINQINLLGRVGRDAEMRGSEAHPVCVFSVATNNVFTKSDGTVSARVDWHRVSVFKPGLREKVAANLRKGDRVFVSGTIRYDEYTDNEDNVVRATTILANDLINLTKRFMSDTEGTSVGF